MTDKPVRGADAVETVLVVLAGLPGAGKTTVAREVARRMSAVHVRIDAIETALTVSGLMDGAAWEAAPDAGYRLGYLLAADHLRNGVSVVADSVNPLEVTREEWRHVGDVASAKVVEVEVICSDAALHRSRVEARIADIPGHVMPTWEQVLARAYLPLKLGPSAVQVDTARSLEEALAAVEVALMGGTAAAFPPTVN